MPIIPAIIAHPFITAAAIGTVASMTQMSKSMSTPPAAAAAPVAPLPETPQVVDEAGTAGAAVTAIEKAKSKRAAIARSKTIFTSPLGLTEESELNTKTLLGK